MEEKPIQQYFIQGGSVKKKILVRGPVLSQSGYGEQARFALRALRTRDDLDIYVQAIRWGNTGWIWEKTEERQWLDEKITKTVHHTRNGGQFDMSLQITIPNEWEKVAPINIGYTAGIETTKVAPHWLVKGNDMDHIIVVSNHSKNVYEETQATAKNESTGEEIDYTLKTPISSVNYAVRDRNNKQKIDGFNPTTNFNFLCVSQWGPRKNFSNTIKWFVEEFHDQNVGLIVKTSIANNSIIDKTKTEEALSSILSSYEDRKCKVYMLHGDLTEEQMNWMYTNKKVKCLVNIAHGEGFGLPLFEAAQCALPIITIGWSGQLDFLRHKGKDYFSKVNHVLNPIQPEAVWEGVLRADSEWAYADQGSFKMKLRDMKKNWSKHKTRAEQLKTIIDDKFTEDLVYSQFCSFLDSFVVEPKEEEFLID